MFQQRLRGDPFHCVSDLRLVGRGLAAYRQRHQAEYYQAQTKIGPLHNRLPRRDPTIRPHDKGVPGKVVAQLMGHAHVDTTLNVYTQVLDRSLRKAADKIGAELFTIVHAVPGGTVLTH